MNIAEACQFLDGQIPDKTVGLQDEIFYFISRLTPMVNTDLLVKDKTGRTLLAWRDDEYCGKGWHIPGSIVRFKESLEHRIIETAKKELATTDITYNQTPLFLHEIILPYLDNRAHFISFLYECSLSPDYVILNNGKSVNDPGYLAWHNGCPDNLIVMQEPYRKFINKETEK
jgi:colanic acid biosynthesis protein WcaH